MADQTEEKKDDFIQNKWRPMMAVMYMSVCAFDFIVAPILFTVVQFWETQAANDAFRQWMPLTLQGGGLFHMAMGAVLGISAYGRTQEKLGGATTNSTIVPTPTIAPTPIVTPAPIVAPAPVPIQTPTATVTLSSSGKKAPLPADEPAL
jgi:hypothetical protein